MKQYLFYFFLLIIIFINLSVSAQDTTKSLAFKENREYRPRSIFYRPDPSYKIRQQFALIHEANAGDPIAQHELGLRYLLGDGFAADTVKGADWIRQAAEKGLASASFNYAILLINGWGTEWNPFEAYKYFLAAANNRMPAAEHIIGLLNLENLIVKKDLSAAYYWFKNASSAGYEPAKNSLKDFEQRIKEENLLIDTTTAYNDTQAKSNLKDDTIVNSSTGLVFIDFDAIRDTSKSIDTNDLVNDLFFTGNDSLIALIKLPQLKKNNLTIDEISFDLLNQFNQSGSPEVYTLLGRMYEIGINVKKNVVKAAEYYVRALRLDSYRSPFLLWKLIQEKNFFVNLKNEVDKKNTSAMFVFAGLFISGFDAQITAQDAVDLLIEASGKNHLPSLVELGLTYYSGKYSPVERAKALMLWDKAVRHGSSEARIRLAASEIFDLQTEKISNEIIKILKGGDLTGSVMAQVALAYCYEKGIGLKQSNSEAVKYYRYAAQRGSRFALDELIKIYNLKRPDDPIFVVD